MPFLLTIVAEQSFLQVLRKPLLFYHVGDQEGAFDLREILMLLQ